MTAQPVYAPPPPPGPPPSTFPSWARWLGLGCGALLLLGTVIGVGVFAVVGRATAEPEKVVHAFLKAAGEGDWPAAHGHFSAALQGVQPLDQFSAIGAANQHLFQVAETTFNSRSVDTAGAELAGTVTLTAGTELPASFRLVRENGEWRINSYQIGN
jgi:hypothetical protein